jgi:hypothetical protein
MADSRLTDLQAKTVIANDDVFYVVDISENTSNKLTFNSLVDENLLTTSGRISSTITNPLCSDVIDIHNDLLSKATNITNLTQSISTEQTKLLSVSAQAQLGEFVYTPLSTVQAGSFTLPAATIADGASIQAHLTIGNILAGDTILLFPPIGLGGGNNAQGLSGLQYSFNALSANTALLHIFNETGASLKINGDAGFAFRYAAQRLALPFQSISGSF